MTGLGSGLVPRRIGADSHGDVGALVALARNVAAWSGRETVVKRILLPGILLVLLSMLAATGYVASGSHPDDVRYMKGEDERVMDAHMDHYREHLARMGLEPLHCE